MPVIYKIDVLATLKAKGYTTYRLRQEKIFGERVIQRIREKEPVSWAVLGTLCELLDCEIGDIIEYVPDEK